MDQKEKEALKADLEKAEDTIYRAYLKGDLHSQLKALWEGDKCKAWHEELDNDTFEVQDGFTQLSFLKMALREGWL